MSGGERWRVGSVWVDEDGFALDDDGLGEDAFEFSEAPVASEGAVALVGREVERRQALRGYPLSELVARLRGGERCCAVRGLSGALASLFVLKLQRALGRPLVVVGPSTRGMLEMQDDLSFFGQEAGRDHLWIPGIEISPYSGLSPDRVQVARRLAGCFRLAMGEMPRVLLLSMRSLVRRCPPRASIAGLSDVIAPGSVLDLAAFRRQLIGCGYVPVREVDEPGTFAIRGGVVDVFSPLLSLPVRIDLFDDEVESLRHFDPESQRSVGEVDGFYVCPVREEIFDEAHLATARRRLRQLSDEQSMPTRSLRRVLADLGHGLHFLGIEALTPAFYDALESLFSYVPEDAAWLWLEPETCMSRAQQWLESYAEQRQRLVADESLAFAPEELFLPAEALRADLASRCWVVSGAAFGLAGAASEAEGEIEENRLDFGGFENGDVVQWRAGKENGLAGLVGRLPEWFETYGTVGVVCRSSGGVERLTSLLEAHGVSWRRAAVDRFDVVPNRPGPSTCLEVYKGALSAGFRLPALGFALLTEDELFGKRARRNASKRRKLEHALASFQALKPGDYLVHVEHGIGRYQGLVQLELAGQASDFLLIHFAGEDKLYVPVYRLNALEKYAGAEQPQRLDKLGGSAWERTKARVKEDVKAMAVDLLRLYAERQSRPGFQFSARDAWFQSFEAEFPFEETPDQAAAIDAVLKDMASPRPMDRLVCGDVGFGKTEVAIRAAFRAVLDGRQVAVLVPTTLLAEQHVASFAARFAGHPIRVEGVSRFRKAQEVRQILADLAVGKVDVVVGTHRLLSSDVRFNRLGLLVVDEEHRFGVTHKEKIKALASSVDVLTLTATPIPRTLQMSLYGLRDLSVISTPPEDRQAIRTYVGRYSESLIRDAVMRELKRGGQVFFLHNRVDTIELVTTRLRELVPEARVGVAHGQMDERRLEGVMLEFIRGQINVLVCTTIIESGLDIPSANCLIVNRADKLGLAQLYQIRGRVGRSNQRAHCYLLVPDQGVITDAAQERLEAIERFSELGSGVEIAYLDMEMRGAGNLLGSAQSGNIAAVGLELYTELMREAIGELQGEAYSPELEPEVHLPLAAYIPETYIPDVQLRLLVYKQLSQAEDVESLFAVYGELVDRYGAAPLELTNLREVLEVKMLVRAIGAQSVDANHSAVIVHVGEGCRLNPAKVVALVERESRRYSLRPDLRLIRYLSKQEAAELVPTTKRVLRELAELAGG